MPSKMNFKDLLQDGVLDLSMADLDEVPVKDVIQLKKVMHLDLSNNRLQTLGKNFISLNFLVHLDLSNNQLTELPDDIGEFKQLKHLDLCNNQLVHLPLSLGQCKFLSWLDLKDNPLLPALSEVVGPCLDAKQCQESAKNIVNFMQMMQMQLDNRRLAEKQKHEVEKAVVEEITETQTQVKKESKKKKKAQKIAEKKEATQVQTNKKENGVKREQPKEENVKKKVQIGKEHIQEIGSEETPRKCNADVSLITKLLRIFFVTLMLSLFTLFIICKTDKDTYELLKTESAKIWSPMISKIPLEYRNWCNQTWNSAVNQVELQYKVVNKWFQSDRKGEIFVPIMKYFNLLWNHVYQFHLLLWNTLCKWTDNLMKKVV